jgi:hypothetical protein
MLQHVTPPAQTVSEAEVLEHFNTLFALRDDADDVATGSASVSGSPVAAAAAQNPATPSSPSKAGLRYVPKSKRVSLTKQSLVAVSPTRSPSKRDVGTASSSISMVVPGNW